MSQQRKKIQMNVFIMMDGNCYAAHQIYSVPSEFADQLVREKIAKFVRVVAKDAHQKESWRKTVRPGDIWDWQITLELPNLIKPRIFAKHEPSRLPPRARSRKRFLEEVGGDGLRVSSTQANAINYLMKHEAKLFPKMLRVIASYAKGFRSDWENSGIRLADRVVPQNMTQQQLIERIEFRHVCVSHRSRDGMAYVEFYGECTWDREHGFQVIMHQNRIVYVSQQGAGWIDRQKSKRQKSKRT